MHSKKTKKGSQIPGNQNPTSNMLINQFFKTPAPTDETKQPENAMQEDDNDSELIEAKSEIQDEV